MKNNHLNLNFRKSKKGNAAIDLIVVMVFIFTFVIFTFTGKYLFDQVNADIQDDPSYHNYTKQIVEEENTRYTTFFDGLFVFYFFLLWMLVLFSAFRADAHPIFLVVTLFLLIFSFYISAELTNTYEDFIADDEFSTMQPEFPMTNWIMSNLLIVAVVIGFSIIIVLYAKNRFNQ